ncbi:MAG: glycosyltransferase family 2 protein [Planctomycetota bacterium]|nr:MAG: glycosyltransferase family 2 protein [Planctomycetota bacterium]REJ89001.1 MAG: glycosyltransferase family 2 protein [Planctomycetota bacterium]REK25024.1 MAG: glycosyltransferase family 2 protein [Planctomycetota bacterium]REK43587.1 MAG: glycosyltransferase family 2 protein [Planctomycetota bacterium]
MALAFEIIFWVALLLLLYTYFGYPLLLVLCHPFARRRASQADDEYRPTISIVLAAYNEASCIREKLENCLGLDYPTDKLQILVGSDGSDDGTNEIAAEFRDRGVELFEFSPRRGKMATVNRVVGKATGEICVFSDISELFDRDALLKLVRHFADPQIGAVTGNHIYHKEKSGMSAGTSFYWKFQRFLQSIESRLHTICMCDGTIYACRRELYPSPADNTINDDVAVPLGIIGQGRRVIFEAEAVARGEVLKETRRFFRQKIRSQAGKYQNFLRFPYMFRPWPPVRFWIYLSHSVMPVMVPWLMVVTLLANIGLMFVTPTVVPAIVYQVLMALQGAFYLTALLGLISERSRLNLPGTAIPFYFVTANVGSLFGFYAFMFGKQGAAWRKVD